MDLAEIRKKAQQEKEHEHRLEHGPGRAAQCPAEDISGMFDRFLEPSEHGLALDVCEDAGIEMPGKIEPPASALYSDPLAVLLAGRQSAAVESDESAFSVDEVEAITDKPVELLCFKVAREEYAINILDIKEIIKPRDVTEVPRVPSFIMGILSLRGVIIPVFNMHERLDLQVFPATGRERVVVVKSGDEFFGLLVDEVIQVVRIAVAGIEQTPSVLEGINREFVNGIGRFDGRMIILLNLEKILDISLH